MKMRNYILPALLISGMASIVMAETIPLPEWAGTTGSPTGSFQALEYINSVKDLLETEAQDELTAEEIPEAKLAIVYRESIKSRLYKVDNSSDTYTLMKALAEIQRFLELYKSQWEYLYQGDTTWALDLTDSNSVGRVMEQLSKLKELQNRLDDTNDTLSGLTNYNAVFGIPGGALIAYNEMERCVWKNEQVRAENLMEFLLQDCNKNGFTKGNTYFFKGKTLRMWHLDLTNAINYTLQSHKYPACLVYIAWSYFDAAKMLIPLGHAREALALLAVEVPNIDSIGSHNLRHIQCGDVFINSGDFTNAVRHLQAALLHTDANNKVISIIMKRVPEGKAIWESVLDKPITRDEALERISSGFFGATNIWCGELIRDALAHEWPSLSEIPGTILSNRVLSNNIFEYKERTFE